MSRKYAPSFATLALVQNAGGGGGGAYTGDATISFVITPSLPGMKSLVGVGAKRGASPSARRRNAHDASGRLTSFSVEEPGSRALPRSSWRVHRWCGRSAFPVDTSTVDSLIIFRLWDEYESSSGVHGGLMRGIKVPQQDFALKRRGGGGGGGGGVY